jgi:hypothetical protein
LVPVLKKLRLQGSFLSWIQFKFRPYFWSCQFKITRRITTPRRRQSSVLLWQSEKETAITRLPQCEKGRTGFTAQKDNCIYGRRGRSKFHFLFVWFFSTTTLLPVD